MPADTVVTETPTTEVNAYAPTATVENSAQTIEQGNPSAEAARRALYEKHYGTTGGAEATTVPTSTTDSASTAQVDQTSATVAPVAAAADVPPAYFMQALQAIQDEFRAIRTQMAAPTATPTGTASAAPVVEAPWVQKLREGDIAGAEQAMADAVAKRVQDSIGKPLIEQAENRTIERMRAMNEAENFVRDVKAANQDLIELEGMITMDAAQRLQRITQSGIIKTTEDAIREYKKAVLDATDTARKVAQKLRGSGKNEAMTRNREVLSASTLAPSGVDTARVQDQGTATPEPESALSYFEKRKAAEASRRGLA